MEILETVEIEFSYFPEFPYCNKFYLFISTDTGVSVAERTAHAWGHNVPRRENHVRE